MRSACKAVLFWRSGATEYIPRVPHSDSMDVAEPRGVVRGALTFPSPEQSPSRSAGPVEPMVHELPDRTAKCLVQGGDLGRSRAEPRYRPRMPCLACVGDAAAGV